MRLADFVRSRFAFFSLSVLPMTASSHACLRQSLFRSCSLALLAAAVRELCAKHLSANVFSLQSFLLLEFAEVSDMKSKLNT